MATTLDIIVKKANKVYHEGDCITGLVVFNSPSDIKHDGITLNLEGTVNLQLSPKNIGIFEAFYNSVKPIQLVQCSMEVAAPGKMPSGKTEVPFEAPLYPRPNKTLFETYHGVFINIQYVLKCTLKRSFLAKDLVKVAEFIVEYKPGQCEKATPAPVKFTISPESLQNIKDRTRVPRFIVSGVLYSTVCCITKPFTGDLVIDHCEIGIKSIELQLVRVETCGCVEGYARDATEIQNIQIGEGNVARGIPIPIYMIFPRLFTCPTLSTSNFKVDGTNVSSASWESAADRCNLARLTRSTVSRIIPLAVTGTLSQRKKACDTIFKKDKGFNISQVDDIPIPQLDNETNPKQLILPLNAPNTTTYMVNSPEAEHALTQYYKVVMKCLTLTTEHKIEVFKFNRRFYDWLTDNVLPHLKDDECYPAFGGVLRIVETMRQNDFVPKNTTENFIFYRQKDLEKKEEEQRKQRDYPGKIFYQPYFLLILIPWLLFILIIILFVLWRTGYCVHWCCDKEKGYDTSITSSFDSPEHFYYPIDETPSISVDLEDEDVDSEPPYNHHEYEYELLRQRGGEDFSPLFSYKVEDENNSFITLPLKRHRPNIETSSSGKRIVSPGKRLRKRLLD